MIFKLSVKPVSSFLSDLQSDTIFGHFCWRLKENQGEIVLSELLDYFKKDKPVFTLSNALFDYKDELYFPKPLFSPEPISDVKGKKDEKILNFVSRKNNKELKYISLKSFNEYLNGSISKINSFSEEPFEYDIKTGIQIDRDTFSSSKGMLYTVAPRFLKKDFKFCIFIKVHNSELFEKFKCESFLYDTFTLGFGKKKSSGFGEFEINSFDEFNEFDEPDNSNGFIVLSNYLPSKDDELSDSYYDILVKHGKMGEEFATGKNPFKNTVIMFKPGSCFRTEKQEEYYGRCTKQSEISKAFPESIQNGIAFSLKCKI